MDSGLLDTKIILSERLQGVTGCTSSIIHKVLIFALKKDSVLLRTATPPVKFFINASFIIDTKGWYCVTKGIISFFPCCFVSGALLSLCEFYC